MSPAGRVAAGGQRLPTAMPSKGNVCVESPLVHGIKFDRLRARGRGHSNKSLRAPPRSISLTTGRSARCPGVSATWIKNFAEPAEAALPALPRADDLIKVFRASA